MTRRCVVVGGAGQVGSMIVDLLRGWTTEVVVVDTGARPDGHPSSATYRRGDVTAVTPDLATVLGQADVLVLAVPEAPAMEGLPDLLPMLRPGALLVDTLSVKSRIVPAVRAGGRHVQALSLNPMFAPALGMAGRPVAAVVVHDGPLAQDFLRLLESRGARLVRMGEDEHDLAAAAVQVLPHAAVLAFGLALADLGLDLTGLDAVAPPPARTLLALLARIASAAPATYWDVQAANPHAAAARAALAAGVHRLSDAAEAGREPDFRAALESTRGLLGADREHYRDLCTTVFSALHRAGPEPTAAPSRKDLSA